MNKKTIAEKLSESDTDECFIHAVVDSISEGVLVCDNEGRLILCNKVARDFFDLPEELIQFEYWHAYATITDSSSGSEFSLGSDLVGPILSDGKALDVDVVVTVKGFSPLHLKISGKSIIGEAGSTAGIVISIQDLTSHTLAQDRMERLVLFDTLTGLPNRKQFMEILHREISMAMRHATVGAILFINLDKFKTINDSLGNVVGDDILRQVSHRIRSMLRESDTLARLGSDEFSIVLPQLDEIESNVVNKAQSVAKKILENIALPFESEGLPCAITASIGIVVFPTGGEHVDDLLKYADSAARRAKQEGGDQYNFFNSDMQATANRRLILEQDIASIIEKKEFEVCFQPIFDTEKKCIVGAEALSRWNHPKYGNISPAEFIPMAEESGVIHTIGNWVLMHALRSLKHWIGAGLVDENMTVAVNVSPRQLADQAFVQYVQRALKIFELAPRHLKLEITEGILLESTEEPILKMNSLREHGVRFSIDDFGTGYSSLSYLKRLPVSQLKIDKTFVDNIESDADDNIIVETIISIARHFKLDIVAEGVESEGQIEILSAMGCHAFQGYFVSKPLLANEFASWVKSKRE